MWNFRYIFSVIWWWKEDEVLKCLMMSTLLILDFSVDFIDLFEWLRRLRRRICRIYTINLLRWKCTMRWSSNIVWFILCEFNGSQSNHFEALHWILMSFIGPKYIRMFIAEIRSTIQNHHNSYYTLHMHVSQQLIWSDTLNVDNRAADDFVCTICGKQIVFLFGFLIIFVNFSFWFACCSWELLW